MSLAHRLRPVPRPTDPLAGFGAVVCINLDDEPIRWHATRRRLLSIGVPAARVERFSAVATPKNHHRGCTLSWRGVVATAAERRCGSVLGFEDDVRFLDDSHRILTAAMAELADQEWDLCYLGAAVWGQDFPLLPGCSALQACGPVTCCHAMAVHQRAYARILAEIPPRGPDLKRWMKEWLAVDQYFRQRIEDGAYRAVIVTPRVATQIELTDVADCDRELRDRYTI
jgi:hypothetical protein